MHPVPLTVEYGDHFGHQHLLVRVSGEPTIYVSLSDPDGPRELAEQLVRIATTAPEGRENG